VRVLVLQHEPLDGPGYLGEALAQRGAALHVVRLDLAEPVPDPSGCDALLVLGGEMNVYQEMELTGPESRSDALGRRSGDHAGDDRVPAAARRAAPRGRP
jgi:hypothetical protein